MNPGHSRNRKPSAEASPVKSVAKELENLRRTFRAVSKAYVCRIESEIEEVRSGVADIPDPQNLPAAKLRDLRDMLILLNKVQVKPDKGRRKDLKKLDALVGDLRQFLDNW